MKVMDLLENREFIRNIEVIISRKEKANVSIKFDVNQKSELNHVYFFYSIKRNKVNKEYCIKFYTDDNNIIQHKNEVDFLEKNSFSENFNFLPLLIYQQYFNNIPFIILEKLPGENLTKIIDSLSVEKIIEVYFYIFKKLRTLNFHQIKSLYAEKMPMQKVLNVKLLLLKRKLNPIYFEYYNFLDKNITNINCCTYSIVHHDISPNNIVINEKNIYLIDWTSFSVLDPRYDFVDAYLKYVYLINKESNYIFLDKLSKMLNISELDFKFFSILNLLEKIVEYKDYNFTNLTKKRWFEYLISSLEQYKN